MYSTSFIRGTMDDVQQTLYNIRNGRTAYPYLIAEQQKTLTDLKDMIQENIQEYKTKKKSIEGKFLSKLRIKVIDNKIYLHEEYLYEICCMKTEFELYMPKTPR